MLLRDIARILEAEVLCGTNLDLDIQAACGSDLMSDALAFFKDQAMMLTGLLNPQAIRTAEMLDMHCVVFVRGKKPGPEMLALAEEAGILVLSTKYPMYTACGKLYAAGLNGGCE